jgi:hypothetical protein
LREARGRQVLVGHHAFGLDPAAFAVDRQHVAKGAYVEPPTRRADTISE